MIDETVIAVGKALHVYHGLGYCSAGEHNPTSNYTCWDEARVVIAAMEGQGVPKDYPEYHQPVTLSARQPKKGRS